MIEDKKVKEEEKKLVKKVLNKKEETIPKKMESDFAVIETGGKQYIVQSGDKIKIEKLEKPEKGDVLIFDNVLLVFKKEKLEIGKPYVKDAKVKGKWLSETRGRKIKNVRYKSKTRRYRRQGHRQIYTEVLIGDF